MTPRAQQCFSGPMTYYDPGVGFGACGFLNTNKDNVVALPAVLMGPLSNTNPYCKKDVVVRVNGKE